jgi:hypothetical protein
MFHSKLSLCAALALFMVAGLFTTPAVAQDDSGDANPIAIARRCIHHVTGHADRCVRHNRTTAEAAVRVIDALQAQGLDRRARAAADKASTDIRRTSNVCVREIRTDCRACVAVLVRLGADKLAREVADECEDQIDRVRVSEAVALRRIRAALND